MPGGGQRRRALSLARSAYENADAYIVLLLRFDIPEYEQVTSQHQRLKFEIESLGG